MLSPMPSRLPMPMRLPSQMGEEAPSLMSMEVER
jgi:hypothetical protein